MNKDILRIEEMGLNGWPSITTNLYKGSVLRLAEGYTKRANSCNPLYLQNKDIEDVIEYSEVFYTKSGLQTVFKIVDDESYNKLDNVLSSKGYLTVDLTNVMTMDLIDKTFFPKHEIEFQSSITNSWVENFLTIYKRTQNKPLVSIMLGNIKEKIITATIFIEEKPVACGYAVIEGEWVGFFDIYVDKKYRGEGLGRSIMSGLMSESIENGAKKSYIQVVADNLPAVTLYKTLGYKESYNYWYRVKKWQ